MIAYHNLSIVDALQALSTAEIGLTTREAKKRLEEYGYNELKKEKRLPALTIFLSQFKNALILLLIFAGTISFLLGENLEGIVIGAIILLNTSLGFIQEYRAERAVEALEKLASPIANVLRDNDQVTIPARELVPGDILLLQAGDIVPADSRIISVASLQIDEASLTGESVPSKKVTTTYPIKTPIADQENMAFTGTTITYGKGTAVVATTGMDTEMGKIATSLQTTQEVPSPLQIKFKQLARQIGVITMILVFIVFISGLIKGVQTVGQMLVFVLALTVSTIPNSLPIIVTIGLSIGAQQLVKKNMLIKQLPAAETLGATTIICSDKTGTLTKNQMTVTEIFANNKIVTVTGTGYDPHGYFYTDNKHLNPQELELLFRIGLLCNNAKLVNKNNTFDIIGDPTEGSLIVLANKGGVHVQQLKHLRFVEELPFDSERKRMSVIYEHNKKREAYVKGAPELLLPRCTHFYDHGKIRKITLKDKQNILRTSTTFAQKALRVLACAYADVTPTKKYSIETIEKNLIFVGIVGMIDPPRDEVKHAIDQCEEAGIKVMMITGDHAVTAQAIGEQIDLFKPGDKLLTGVDIDHLSDQELVKTIDQVSIIARALPIQKSRIVDALQKRGHIVAMTGDGVNDAPALKKADIGIAMGITGTPVAKEVAKAILLDDNFASIVTAVAEGRNIYSKMIKSATYLLSCNSGEITSVFTALMINFPLPLLPLQLLLMSILTDDFPALGLGIEHSEENVMKQPPRDPQAKPLTKHIIISIVLFGLIMGIGTLFLFSPYKDDDLPKAQTIAFTTLVMFQMFAVLSSRTTRHSLKQLNPFSNLTLFGAICLSVAVHILVVYFPPLQSIFGTVPLTLMEWLVIIGLASIGFIAMEVAKIVIYHPVFSTKV